jgi:hypothetical protein
MGRIHRYGQEKDCLIFNFVAPTRAKGRVLPSSSSASRQIEEPTSTRSARARSSTFWATCSPPTNWRKCCARCMRATRPRNRDQGAHRRAGGPRALPRITNSTLEGLAKRELNLSAIVGKIGRGQGAAAGARGDRGLLRQAAPSRDPPQGRRNGPPHLSRRQSPPALWSHWRALGAPLRPARPRLPQDHLRQAAAGEATPRWSGSRRVIPCSRPCASPWTHRVQGDLQRGAVFYDLHADPVPARLLLRLREGRARISSCTAASSPSRSTPPGLCRSASRPSCSTWPCLPRAAKVPTIRTARPGPAPRLS